MTTMNTKLRVLLAFFILLIGCHASGQEGTPIKSSGPPIPQAGDAGTFLGSNGPSQPLSWKVPAGGGASGGWTTSLNIDFTAQTNQVMRTDGTYTIGGVVFTKLHSSSETSTGVNACTGGSCSGSNYVVPAVNSSITIQGGGGDGTAAFGNGFYAYWNDGAGHSIVGLVTSTTGSAITMTNKGFPGTSTPSTVMLDAGSIYATAMVISGVGLQFCPESSTNYFAGTRTAIFLQLPLTQVVSGVAIDTPVRAWANINPSLDLANTNYDGAILSFDILTNGSQTGIEVVRGYDNVSGGSFGFLGGTEYTNAYSQVVPNPPPGAYASNGVIVIQNPIGFNGLTTQLIGATYDAGWPSAQSLLPLSQGVLQMPAGGGSYISGVVSLSDGGVLAIGTGDQLVIGLGALRSGSPTVLREVFTNFRVDTGGYN